MLMSLKGTSIKTRMETHSNPLCNQLKINSLKGTSIKTRMETIYQYMSSKKMVVV